MPGNPRIVRGLFLLLQNPRAFARVFAHRLVKPQLWSTFLQKQTGTLSDAAFMRLCGFEGSVEGFINLFHDTARLRFFFHPRNQKDFFLELITRTQPYDQILSEAQDVLENRFQTLGSSKVHLGERINWYCDFKSGKVWPLRKLTTEEILDLNNPSDIKVPWELSRFHQLWWLGKAYWVTRNERYAQKFGELIESWIEQNPLGKGPNWTTAMEVAIRACNWVAGYYFFCESPSLSPQFWCRFLKSLYAHGHFIEYHQERAWHNGNHFLSDVVGIIFLGNLFHGTAFGRKWLGWGVAHLEDEMKEQVHPDGVDYEKSTSYHRLVLELFSTATVLCQRNTIALSSEHLRRLEKMFEYVLHYTRPDGSIPLIGDADDGRLFRFIANEDPNDHRHILSVGSILFGRSDFKVAAGRYSQDALWLFGGEGFEKYQMLRGGDLQFQSQVFRESGFCVLRSKDAHVFVDAAAIGMKGPEGHGHNDTLSFELWVDGSSLIVDSGTYAYTSDRDARNDLRSTRAHNTIVVDGKELAEFAGLWSVRADETRPEIEWKPGEQRDVLIARHFGYQSLPSPVTVQRQVEFNKEQFELLIHDSVRGTGRHHIESFLHFPPDAKLELASPQKAIARNQKGSYIIAVNAAKFEILQTWFSRSYGVRERNQTLRLALEAQLPTEIQLSIKREADG